MTTQKPDFQVQKTILAQLGGKARFQAMTGSSQFAASDRDNSLSMKLKRNKSKATYLKITYTIKDTYTLEFFKFTRSLEKVVIETLVDAHASDLQKMFTSVTGFDTHI